MCEYVLFACTDVCMYVCAVVFCLMCTVWVVREQVFVAALDCGESTLAQV